MMKLLKWPQKAVSETPSQVQMQQLLNSISDVVMVINQAGQIAFINTCWHDITGFTVTDSLQQTFADFLHPEDRSSWHQLLNSVQHHSREIIWLRLITANHEVRWCEIRLQPMQADKIFPLSVTLCDITPQVREEKLRDAGHRSLQSLVNRLPAMLYRARNNKSWTMEYVSSGCELITGYSADKLLNQSQICLGSLIHDDDAAYVWDQVQQALQMQTTFDLLYRVTKADGQQITVQDKGRGLYSDSGMILGVEGIILQARNR